MTDTPAPPARPPRVIAICVFSDGGRILVIHGSDPRTGEPFYRPVGGAVEAGERGGDAVVREVREELGVEVTDVRPVGFLENFFKYDGRAGHELVLVYDARLRDETLYRQEALRLVEPGPERSACWRELASFADGGPPLVPDGLLRLLLRDPGG